jgi:hypothetical protein
MSKNSELYEIIETIEKAEELLDYSSKIHPMVVIRNQRRIKRILKELRGEIIA